MTWRGRYDPSEGVQGYRGTSLTRKRTLLVGPYRRSMPRVLGGSKGGGRFLIGEVALNSSILPHTARGVTVGSYGVVDLMFD